MYRIFSGSFLGNLEWLFHKIMVTEKNKFSSNAYHNFAKSKIIPKCENDNPTLLRRPGPAPYFHSLF